MQPREKRKNWPRSVPFERVLDQFFITKYNFKNKDFDHPSFAVPFFPLFRGFFFCWGLKFVDLHSKGLSLLLFVKHLTQPLLGDYFIFRRYFFTLTTARAMLHWTRTKGKNRGRFLHVLIMHNKRHAHSEKMSLLYLIQKNNVDKYILIVI